ncbi:MAG: exodeoxyribonuclease III [Eggerthellaceae bacterium]|nr:exodeoxyribonuclease III [Eggerthellaceae bacterium]
MRLISWNVNGLRAVLKKDFQDTFDQFDADVFALQETKLQPGQVDLELPGYHQFWSYAEKKGYSGTAVFCKERPRQVLHGLGDEYLDAEGRIVAAEFEDFWFVDVYTPNAQDQLARIDHRMQWDDAFRDFCKGLEEGVLPAGVPVERDGDEGYGVGHAAADLPRTAPGEMADPKPVVMCGDFNVAHQEIDLKNPGPNRGNAGFSDEERGQFTKLVEAGFTDTFRLLHPDVIGAYSWWSYRFKARQNNAGWRIDYFLVSDALRDRVEGASIYSEVFGSDHCPVGLELDLA